LGEIRIALFNQGQDIETERQLKSREHNPPPQGDFNKYLCLITELPCWLAFPATGARFCNSVDERERSAHIATTIYF
jgi:hypothetical protein